MDIKMNKQNFSHAFRGVNFRSQSPTITKNDMELLQIVSDEAIETVANYETYSSRMRILGIIEKQHRNLDMGDF